MSTCTSPRTLPASLPGNSMTPWFGERKDPYSARETASAKRLVQRMTKKVQGLEYWQKKGKATKEEFHGRLYGRKATAKLGQFPAYLYEQNLLVQQSELCKLPIEIITVVLKKLGDPDKTSMALTCKDLMAKVEARRQDAQRLAKKRTSVAKPQRLAVLVRLRDWVPSDLKLCYGCVRYLRRAGTGQWVGDRKVVERGMASKKAVETGPRCEMCRDRDRIAAIKAGAETQRLYSLVGTTLG